MTENSQTPAEYVDTLMQQIVADTDSDSAIQAFADDYLKLAGECTSMGVVPLTMEQFVTVNCDGELVSHAFDTGEPDDGADLLVRTMDMAVRHGVHIVGYYKATLTIDPDSFVAVTMDDHKACADRFVADEKEARAMVQQQIAAMMGDDTEDGTDE